MMVVNEVNQMFLSEKTEKDCAGADARLDEVMAALGYEGWRGVAG